jgi:[ribosomal protein S5]-alanine N-acetyltransferase
VRIETDRLVIRDFESGDVEGVHAWRSDAEVARWMNFKPASRAESHAFLVSCIAGNEAEPRQAYNCAIVHKASGTTIGWIGWGPPSAHKAGGGDADFGYALRRDAWGRGYGTEALRAVIDVCLKELGIKTFFGETDVQNARSARVMERAGMEPMGVAPWDETSMWFRVRQL